MTSTRAPRVVLLTAVGLAVLALVAWKLACSDCESDRVTLRVSPNSTPATSTAVQAAAPAPSAIDAGERDLRQIESALFQNGSLRGTQAPGWGVGRDEELQPNRALRDRFDYYLLALSEASLADLTRLVRHHAERDLGPKTAEQVMQLWARYLQLQQHAYQVVANPIDPNSMRAALQEHRQVRQSILGLHWARAFYADEETALEAELAQGNRAKTARQDADRTLLAAPADGDPQTVHQQRVARYGEEAAQRLRALDEQEAQWAKRLAQARAEVESIRGNASLSETQRAAAIDTYLATAFPDQTERLRASGLVGH